ncbi:MAG: pyridoxamine 5'-phosphate oxidase family protein [Thermoflavifilum sp.]|nr:pyridoxamine 5'-phosphate oxidase family protein [Thermoflavifilum sp.]
MLGWLTPSQIDACLERNAIGRIGYLAENNRVFIIPVTYLFDGASIIAHSREGDKIDALRNSQEVCFQVDEIADHQNWQSILVWGTYEEITQQKERYYALDRLIRKINMLNIHQSATQPIDLDIQAEQILVEAEKNIVYRIRIKEKTGRFQKQEHR